MKNENKNLNLLKDLDNYYISSISQTEEDIDISKRSEFNGNNSISKMTTEKDNSGSDSKMIKNNNPNMIYNIKNKKATTLNTNSNMNIPSKKAISNNIHNQTKRSNSITKTFKKETKEVYIPITQQESKLDINKLFVDKEEYEKLKLKFGNNSKISQNELVYYYFYILGYDRSL